MIPQNVGTLDLDAIIPLFAFTNYNLLAPNESLRFCNYTGVVYEGMEFMALGCESDGWDFVGQGAIANPTLKVSNVGRVISDWLFKIKSNSNYRLEGATLIRVLTQKKFLDGQPNENDAIKSFTPDKFVIEQVPAETYQAVEFKLSTAFDIDGLTLPSRSALRSCPWIYRSPECGYTGSKMFDLNDQYTTAKYKDKCSKSLSGCRARFGVNAILPFGGFPGLNSFG